MAPHDRDAPCARRPQEEARGRCAHERVEPPSDRPSNPELSLERRELGEAIAQAAAELPDDQRAALVLAEMHGLTIAEIAEALDVPENTAKTRLFRAREKMRASLANWRKP